MQRYESEMAGCFCGKKAMFSNGNLLGLQVWQQDKVRTVFDRNIGIMAGVEMLIDVMNYNVNTNHESGDGALRLARRIDEGQSGLLQLSHLMT